MSDAERNGIGRPSLTQVVVAASYAMLPVLALAFLDVIPVQLVGPVAAVYVALVMVNTILKS